MTVLTFLATWLALSVLTVAALAAVSRLQRGGAMPPEPVAVVVAEVSDSRDARLAA